MHTISGGELMTDILKAYGIGTVFSLAGTSHAHFLDPLERAGIEIVSHRHEGGAVGAADGYGRMTNKPGCALVIAEQGLANAIGALSVAWHAQSPLVVFVATPPRDVIEADVNIDQSKLELVDPITKWARLVPSVSRLQDYVNMALKHATTGRKGPTVLLLPQDVVGGRIEAAAIRPLAQPVIPAAPSDEIDRAVEILARAERPVILTGGGAAYSDCSAPLRHLYGSLGIAVLGNSMGRGQVCEDGIGSFSWPYAQIAVNEADVVMIVGARMTVRTGYGLPPRFAPDASFIQLDIEPGAFHRNRRIDVPLLGDARATLESMASRLIEARRSKRYDTRWLRDALSDRRARLDELGALTPGKTHPAYLAAQVEQRLPEDAIFVADGGAIANWMYGHIRIKRAKGFFDHYPMGAMGSCTSIAVGVAAALKEEHGAGAPPVVLVTGDGALGFHPAELHGAARAGLNLKIIVGNDGAWGTEVHEQRKVIGRSVNTMLDVLDYHKLAEVFLCTGLHVSDAAMLADVLDEAFATTGPVLVNVETDLEAGAEIKSNPLTRMIIFNDLVTGQARLNTRT